MNLCPSRAGYRASRLRHCPGRMKNRSGRLNSWPRRVNHRPGRVKNRVGRVNPRAGRVGNWSGRINRVSGRINRAHGRVNYGPGRVSYGIGTTATCVRMTLFGLLTVGRGYRRADERLTPPLGTLLLTRIARMSRMPALLQFVTIRGIRVTRFFLRVRPRLPRLRVLRGQPFPFPLRAYLGQPFAGSPCTSRRLPPPASISLVRTSHKFF